MGYKEGEFGNVAAERDLLFGAHGSVAERSKALV